MLRTFPIEFVKQILEQKLYQEHLKDNNFFGGKNQIEIHSYYEQLKTQEEIDRFVETVRDLDEQQNRMGLIGNGTIISPENPTYTNLYSSTIIPLSFACNLRCDIENRDDMILTINNLIDKLKGRKVDIAQLDCFDHEHNSIAIPFMVGTIGQNDGDPKLKNGDYVEIVNQTAINNLYDAGVDIDYNSVDYLYCKDSDQLKVCKISASDLTLPYNSFDTEGATLTNNKTITVNGSAGFNLKPCGVYKIIGKLLVIDEGEENVELELVGTLTQAEYNESSQTTTLVVQFDLENNIQTYVENYEGFTLESVELYAPEFTIVEDDGTYGEIIFPPEHESFEKWKVSLSFDSVRVDEPRNLNSKEFVDVSFGGSATVVNNGVKLGNDLLKINFKRLGIMTESYIDFTSQNGNKDYWLEPLEMPSGLNANTSPIQLISNKFKAGSHTDGIANTLQYTFICDENIDILDKLYDYGRYGIIGITKDDISPNMIFGIREIYCSWGIYKNKDIKVKMVEDVDIENTEGDVLTLSLTMQVQGDDD